MGFSVRVEAIRQALTNCSMGPNLSPEWPPYFEILEFSERPVWIYFFLRHLVYSADYLHIIKDDIWTFLAAKKPLCCQTSGIYILDQWVKYLDKLLLHLMQWNPNSILMVWLTLLFINRNVHPFFYRIREVCHCLMQYDICWQSSAWWRHHCTHKIFLENGMIILQIMSSPLD